LCLTISWAGGCSPPDRNRSRIPGSERRAVAMAWSIASVCRTRRTCGCGAHASARCSPRRRDTGGRGYGQEAVTGTVRHRVGHKPDHGGRLPDTAFWFRHGRAM
jgi:hypothetical protein